VADGRVLAQQSGRVSVTATARRQEAARDSSDGVERARDFVVVQGAVADRIFLVVESQGDCVGPQYVCVLGVEGEPGESTGGLFAPKGDVLEAELGRASRSKAGRLGVFADSQEKEESNSDEIGGRLYRGRLRAAFVGHDILKQRDW
jgi:hypothetical protein